MTGIDTNVLVRFLTDDDEVQADRAARLIGTLTARGERAYLSPLVLCELSWVLRGAYDISKADLLATLEDLMAAVQFVIGDKDVVRVAIAAYRDGRGDFADYLIGAQHTAAGCDRTVTLDRRLRRDAGFQLL